MTRAGVWGDPPVPDVVARLLGERWSVPAEDTLTVDVDPAAGELRAHWTRGRARIELDVRYTDGPDGAEPWMMVVDALDALVGQLAESDLDHRALPRGEGVDFQGARFEVRVERRVPELERLADQLIDGR